MRLFTRWLGALLSLLALGLLAAAPAQAELAVPPLSGRVVDQTGTLTPVQVQALDGKLARFEAEAGPQIVLLLVTSTQQEDIAAYAWRVADQWKIGRREVGDGVLVVVAKGDRRVRIEVAKALEGAVPDLAARQIIDRAIKPAFQRNDYAGGLNAGVDQLMARIRGEHLPAPQPRSGVQVQNGSAGGHATGDSLGGWQSLALFFFLGVPVAGALLSAMLGRKLGSLATAGGAGTAAGLLAGSWPIALGAGIGALVLVGLLGIGSTRRGRGGLGGGGFVPPVIWGGGGGGWSGGGGGDSGGFSSGGGGDFGGGGASGDW
ncbi:TPM domain-containing protein [Ideonella azotifigens]|uniref:TPM domain-containing protein n=2 Tax=Ideonella azotifigens TaxID=513160 RepID=A0ABN1KB09_9BURK|nr:TPM domain-containing protein [Ideonella azotifigens]MCD2338806.1 TPM domain-containing protein [Ideonella azotifigens]